MNKSRRIKQNAVVFLAILIVVLILWRLNSRRHYGGMGGAITTNIFGAATMTLLNGAGDSAQDHPPPPTNESVSILTTNPPPQHPTNRPPSGPPPSGPPPPRLSTNLLNTNGPVTMINVPAGDLVTTPPGVTYAATVAEASAIEERLGAASAKGGDIQISLYWNDYNDLDLHCVDPSNFEIYYLRPVSPSSAGELDVDRNARPPYTKTPVENIYWPVGKAPKGSYRIFVVFYAPRNGLDGSNPTPFTVRVVLRDGQTFYFRSSVRFIPMTSKYVCTLDYDPDNPDPAHRFRFVNQ